MNVISRCGPLGVEPNRAANVTYSMFLCNGWGIGIVLQVPWDSINPAEKGKISGKPYIGVMTYNALAFTALKQLGNYRQFYTISFENLKT